MRAINKRLNSSRDKPAKGFYDKQAKGFTLVEVLVAVAIMAFMIPALMLLMMQQVDTAGVLRDKTIAHWLAENKATELRLDRQFKQRLLQREQFETVEMAGEEWVIEVDIERLQGIALILYRVKVRRDGTDEPLVTLDTYLGGV